MQTVTIAPNTNWGGTFEILEIVRTFKNGKIAVRVNFHGKDKIFNINPEDIKTA